MPRASRGGNSSATTAESSAPSEGTPAFTKPVARAMRARSARVSGSRRDRTAGILVAGGEPRCGGGPERRTAAIRGGGHCPGSLLQLLGNAAEGLDLPLGGRELCAGDRKVAREELRIVVFDRQLHALRVGIEAQPLNGTQFLGVQQTAGGLAGFLDVLVEDAGQIGAGLDHQGIALHAADRIAEDAGLGAR